MIDCLIVILLILRSKTK